MTASHDIELLQFNITTPNSRLVAMLTLDRDAAAMNSREYDAHIYALLNEYRKCPNVSKRF